MKHNLLRWLTFSLILFFYSTANSQITFQKTFGGSLDDVANWVANTSTGYLVAGYTTTTTSGRDGYLLNLDFSGNIIWQKRIGGSGSDQFNGAYETVGGFMVLGETDSYGAGGTDTWVLKISPAGTILWSKTIGDAAYSELGTCIIPVSGDRILVSGAKAPIGTTGYNSCFYLLDNTGQIIWSRYYESGSIGNLIRSSYVDNGIIYASGGAEAEGAFMRLDLETGDIISTTLYPGNSNETMYYQQPAPDGNILLCDGTWSATNGVELKQWVNKITPQGQTIWSKVYSRPNVNLRGRIESAGDGNFLLTPYDPYFTSTADALLVKIDESGNVMWSRNYGRPGPDWFWKSQLAPDNGFIAVGSATGPNGDRDVLIVKTDDQGFVEGCCIPNGEIIATNFVHPDQDYAFTTSTWTPSIPTNNQQVNANLQEHPYCANQPVEIFNDIALCPNDAFTFNGVDYYAPDEVIQVLPGLFGCDTTVHYSLLLLPSATRSEEISFCAGGSVVIGGQTYTQSGTVIETIPGAVGCDTIVTYTLTLRPSIEVFNDLGLCPNEALNLHGINYYAPGEVSDTLTGAFGCDSIIHYGLLLLPQPTRSEEISFCAGGSVVIGGQTYTQSGTVIETIPGAVGCDTIVTYTLTLRPSIEVFNDLGLCPNEALNLHGINYYAPGEVSDTLTGAFGCDSITHYGLLLLPQPTRSVAISLCPGESVVIGGHSYTQPGNVIDTIPASMGCDTIVTYTITSPVPAPSVVSIHCPANISVIADPGTAPLVVNYDPPTATSNCPCPGVALTQTAGLPSGGAFPNGVTQVCYAAKDSCGHSASCCFTVTVREVQPCDIKVNGCIRYELLSITADPAHNLTYRIRVVNNCANKLIYTAIQLPDAVVALAPNNLSVFTAESGREYDVRNPNFSPFYSIRFKSILDSISGGGADIFKFTLPAQSAPLYMDITSRLAPQLFYEAHLNTFYCPIGITMNRNEDATAVPQQGPLLFPNPTDGTLLVDLGDWNKAHFQWRIFNSQGQQIMTDSGTANEELLRIEMTRGMPDGLFFFEIMNDNGQKETMRFVLQR